jgi:hypothetical protein
LGGFTSQKTILNRFLLATRASALEFKSFCLILANKKGHRLVSFFVGGDGEI